MRGGRQWRHRQVKALPGEEGGWRRSHAGRLGSTHGSGSSTGTGWLGACPSSPPPPAGHASVVSVTPLQNGREGGYATKSAVRMRLGAREAIPGRRSPSHDGPAAGSAARSRARGAGAAVPRVGGGCGGGGGCRQGLRQRRPHAGRVRTRTLEAPPSPLPGAARRRREARVSGPRQSGTPGGLRALRIPREACAAGFGTTAVAGRPRPVAKSALQTLNSLQGL